MRVRAMALGLCLSVSMAPLGCVMAAEADLVLYNAHVITVDPKFSIQSAVAVKDGKIVAVGGPELAKAYHAPSMIDLHGRTLMPGFEDTHLHPKGKSPRDIEVTEAHSMAELQQMLRDKAKLLGPGEWITGAGWQEVQFKENRNPTREDLDVGAPDNPVVLTRAGGHSSVGNSMALKLAHIDKHTADPTAGLIEHNANGEPNESFASAATSTASWCRTTSGRM